MGKYNFLWRVSRNALIMLKYPIKRHFHFEQNLQTRNKLQKKTICTKLIWCAHLNKYRSSALLFFLLPIGWAKIYFLFFIIKTVKADNSWNEIHNYYTLENVTFNLWLWSVWWRCAGTWHMAPTEHIAFYLFV